jgi:hypothetical protein
MLRLECLSELLELVTSIEPNPAPVMVAASNVVAQARAHSSFDGERTTNYADPHRFTTFSGANSGPTDSNDPKAAKLHRGTLSHRNSAIGSDPSLRMVEKGAKKTFQKGG